MTDDIPDSTPTGPYSPSVTGSYLSSERERIPTSPIPGYEILGELGRGGMGVVFRARQIELNREVAVKMILSRGYDDPMAQARFLVEAEAIAQLDHPQIVQVYEFGRQGSQPFFVLELVEGGSLANQLKKVGPLDIPGAVALVEKLANGIASAHQQGIVHRDLKPGNVLLTKEGEPKITDFGLAKTEKHDLTETGAIVGTPAYMAPEQAAGKTRQVGTPVDIYALGAILYELLTGHPPFRGETALDTLRQITEKEPLSLRAQRPDIDRDLEAIALKCLEKDPKHRYATAEALAKDLRAYQSGAAVTARSPGFIEWTLKWLKRNAISAIRIILLGLLWGAILGMGLVANPRDAQRFLIPNNPGIFNPVGMAHLASKVPLIPPILLCLALLLTLTIGWWVRWAARPKTTGATLGWSALLGLIATLVTFLFIGPKFAVGSFSRPLHPVEDRRGERIFNPRTGALKVTPKQEAYLDQFRSQTRSPLAPNQPAGAPILRQDTQFGGWGNRDLQMSSLLGRAQETNRLHAAWVGIQVGLLSTILLIVGAAVISAMASDHVVRSGRGPWACVSCYLELYVPTIAAVAAMLLAALVTTGMVREPRISPYWTAAGLAAILAAIALGGYLRKWHPLIRTGLYLLWGVAVLWSVLLHRGIA